MGSLPDHTPAIMTSEYHLRRFLAKQAKSCPMDPRALRQMEKRHQPDPELRAR